MDTIWQSVVNASSSGSEVTVHSVLLSLLLAFVMGQALAWLYYYTHTGLSYSRSFVQALILITVVVAMVMYIIAGSFVVAVGLLGALSIIRFRNMLKDTRDIAFVFCALVIGMAVGSQRYTVAILGSFLIGIIILYLHWSNFGAHEPHNAFLRFTLGGHMTTGHPVLIVLKKFCGGHMMISSQDNSFDQNDVEYAYQVMIKNVSMNEQMLSELKKIEGVRNVSLTVQEQLLEI